MMRKLFVCENCHQIFQRQPDEMVLHYRGLPLCSERCAAQLSAAIAEKKDSTTICKDCIHQTVCSDRHEGFEQEAELCEHFSNKSEWFHLSAKDHETAYYVIGYGDYIQIIEEPIYGWGIKNGKYCVIDERGDFYEIGELVFLTKEAAKKAVERRENSQVTWE